MIPTLEQFGAEKILTRLDALVAASNLPAERKLHLITHYPHLFKQTRKQLVHYRLTLNLAPSPKNNSKIEARWKKSIHIARTLNSKKLMERCQARVRIEIVGKGILLFTEQEKDIVSFLKSCNHYLKDCEDLTKPFLQTLFKPNLVKDVQKYIDQHRLTHLNKFCKEIV